MVIMRFEDEELVTFPSASLPNGTKLQIFNSFLHFDLASFPRIRALEARFAPVLDIIRRGLASD